MRASVVRYIRDRLAWVAPSSVLLSGLGAGLHLGVTPMIKSTPSWRDAGGACGQGRFLEVMWPLAVVHSYLAVLVALGVSGWVMGGYRALLKVGQPFIPTPKAA